MEFIGEFERRDGDLYFTVRVPIRPSNRRPNVPVIGKDRDTFYLYVDKGNDAYVMKLVGAKPDPNMVKQSIQLGDAQ